MPFHEPMSQVVDSSLRALSASPTQALGYPSAGLQTSMRVTASVAQRAAILPFSRLDVETFDAQSGQRFRNGFEGPDRLS